MNTRKRLIKVAVIFFKIILDFSKEYKLIRKKGYAYAQKKMKTRHEKRAQQLYNLTISLGGVLIKLCQFFSARRDVFPEPYIKILSSLQDNVPPVPFDKIETVLREEFGDYTKFFKTIDKQPLASASLGQVHRGVLTDGREVAIKILKPGIEHIIDIDCAILHYVFKLLSNFKVVREKLDIFGLLNEFIRVTGNELSFKREAAIAKKFKQHFTKFDYVIIPEIHEQLCTDRIIVMQYMPGDKITAIDVWKHKNNDPVMISKRLIEIYIEQLLYLRVVHFDPHPGNILITHDNRITLIDFGMSGEITDLMQQGLIDGLLAFVDRDYMKLYDVLCEQGFIKKNIQKNAILGLLEYFFDELLDAIKLDRESIYTTDLTPVIDDLIEILYSQPFNIPYEWAFTGKTVGTISGIIATLNPAIHIYNELKPYAKKVFWDNVTQLAKKKVSDIKDNLMVLSTMPKKINTFMEGIERGKIQFNVDYSDLHEKIESMKIFAVKLISFFLTICFGIAAYIINSIRSDKTWYLFAGAGILFLLISLFYKKRKKNLKL